MFQELTSPENALIKIRLSASTVPIAQLSKKPLPGVNHWRPPECAHVPLARVPLQRTEHAH